MMTAGQVARALGIGLTTLRRMEQRGLVQPRRASVSARSWRYYSPADLALLRTLLGRQEEARTSTS